MKIKYVFVNGEVAEVDVEEKFGTVIVESRKEEHAGDEKQRYHCFSYDSITYEGKEFGTDGNITDEMEKQEDISAALEAFEKLTPKQQQRLKMLAEGLSVREIARREGSNHKSVLESINAAKRNILKYL